MLHGGDLTKNDNFNYLVHDTRPALLQIVKRDLNGNELFVKENCLVRLLVFDLLGSKNKRNFVLIPNRVFFSHYYCRSKQTAN